MPLDLPGRQPTRIQTDDRLVESLESSLPFAHDLRLKRPVAIPRHFQGQFAKLPFKPLGAAPIAGVTAVPAGSLMLLVTQMIGQFRSQRFFQQPLLQLLQQPIFAQ